MPAAVSPPVQAGPNPYVGPRPFEPGETLYGREDEITDLYYLWNAERIVMLHSPSGAGKSSLLQAGLLPKLRGAFDIWGPTRVNQKPAGEGGNRYVASAILGLEEGVPERLRRPPEALAGLSLTEYFETRPRRRSAPKSVALLFDQFEEVLTIDPLAVEAKEEFFDQLGELLHNPRIWALFALREDYLAPLDPYTHRVPTHLKNRFRIDLLGLEGARQAIVEPARRGHRAFPAVDRLVHDLATMQVQQPDGSFREETGHHVEPVQLQVVCLRLWDEMPIDDLSVDAEDLERFGDVTEALANYYATSVHRVAGGNETKERAIREWCGEALIAAGGIRGQVLKGSGESGGLANPLIEGLLDSHLVRAEKRAGATWYELAHDRLIRAVQSDNNAWVAEHLSEVQQRSTLWERQGYPTGLLVRGNELATAEDWAAAHETTLTATERRFLQASRKAQERFERERSQARRIRRLAWVSLVVGALAVLASFFALWEKRNAEEGERRAEQMLKAATGVALHQKEPNQAMLTLLEVDDLETIPPSIGATATLYKTLESRLWVTLTGHKDSVLSASFSAEVPWVITASRDRTARVWNSQTGEEIAQLTGHGEWVEEASLSPKGKRAVTVSNDGKVRVWDVTSGREIVTLSETSAFRDFRFLPDNSKIVAVSVDGKVMAWDPETGLVTPFELSQGIASVFEVRIVDLETRQEITAFECHTGFLLSSDGCTAVSNLMPLVESGLEVQIRRVGSRGDGTTIEDPESESLSGLWFNREGSRVATIASELAVVWDSATGELISRLSHSDRVHAVSFSPDGDHVLTVAAEHAYLWEISTGKRVATLSGHTHRIFEAAFNPDGSLLVTVSADNTARIWKKTVDGGRTVFEGGQASFSPNGARIAQISGCGDGCGITLWSSADGRFIDDFQGFEAPVESIAFNAEGSRLVVTSAGKAHVLGIHSGETQHRIEKNLTLVGQGESTDFWDASCSADGSRVVTFSHEGRVGLWDAETGLQISDFQGAEEGIMPSFSSDGTRVLIVHPGGVRIVDAGTGEALHALEGHATPLTGAWFSPDSSRVVTASMDHTARIWDSATGEELFLLRRHTGAVLAAAFNPDGSRVVTASEDGTARIWDAANGQNLIALRGHAGFVYDASFSPDGRRIVTASSDTTARLWNAETGAEIASLEGHIESVARASFSGDGAFILTVSQYERTLRLWPNDIDLLLGLNRARTYLCLDESFREKLLSEHPTEAIRNRQACQHCVPVFFEELSPEDGWKTYGEAWRTYEECLESELEN